MKRLQIGRIIDSHTNRIWPKPDQCQRLVILYHSLEKQEKQTVWFEYSLVKWDVRNSPGSPSETSENRRDGYMIEYESYLVRFGSLCVSSREMATVLSLEGELDGVVEDVDTVCM